MQQHRWTAGPASAVKRSSAWAGPGSLPAPAPSANVGPIARLHTQVAHLAQAVYQVSHAPASRPAPREPRGARAQHWTAAAAASPRRPEATPARRRSPACTNPGAGRSGSAGSELRRGGGGGATAPALTEDNMSHASRNELLHRRLSLLSLAETGEERGPARAVRATDPAQDGRRRRRRPPPPGASPGQARPVSISRALNEHYRRKERTEAWRAGPDAEAQASPSGVVFPAPPQGIRQQPARWPDRAVTSHAPAWVAPANGEQGVTDAAWRARVTAAVATLQQQVADMTAVLSDHRNRVTRLERAQLRPRPNPGPHTPGGVTMLHSPPTSAHSARNGGVPQPVESLPRVTERRAESMPPTRPRQQQEYSPQQSPQQQQRGSLTLGGVDPPRHSVSALWPAVHDRTGGWEDLPGGFTSVSPSAPLGARRARSLSRPQKPKPSLQQPPAELQPEPSPAEDTPPAGSGVLPVIASPSAAQQRQGARTDTWSPPAQPSPEPAPDQSSPAPPRDGLGSEAAAKPVPPPPPTPAAEEPAARGPAGVPSSPERGGLTARDRRHSSASLLPGEAPGSPLARTRAESGEGALVRGASPELRTALLRRYSRMSNSMDSGDQSDTPGEALLPPTVAAGDLGAEEGVETGKPSEEGGAATGGNGGGGLPDATSPIVGSPRPSPVPFSTTEDSDDDEEEEGDGGQGEGWMQVEGPPPAAASRGDATTRIVAHAPPRSGRAPAIIDTIPAAGPGERRSGTVAAPPTPAGAAEGDATKGRDQGGALHLGEALFAGSDGFTSSGSGGGVLLGPVRDGAAGAAVQSHSSEPDTGGASGNSRSRRKSPSRSRHGSRRRSRSHRRRRRASTSEQFFV